MSKSSQEIERGFEMNSSNSSPHSYSTKEGKVENYEGDDEFAGEEVTRLARQITNTSILSTGGNNLINPFIDSTNPALNPDSGQFDPRAWAKQILNIVSRDPDRYPHRTAGVSFRNLGAYGYGTGTDYQKTVSNVLLKGVGILRQLAGNQKKVKIQILKDFDGLIKHGELCLVLGRPGSGCTTLLKTIACETHGFHLDDSTEVNYQGVPRNEIATKHRGDVIYSAETDVHFPSLSVGDTLKFAALATTPRNRIQGVTRDQYATHMRDVTMAIYGLSHTINTKVGNEYVRGVSGGERKRVSIAEVSLGRSPLQCWDNSTRGLDSATALEFIRTLRTSAELSGASMLVSLYQASQSSYDLFDRVTILYEGRQIFFGHCSTAKDYFLRMGFYCSPRQTTGDFLTSLTSPSERVAAEGYENRVPQTPDEFVTYWKNSPEYQKLIEEIDQFNSEYVLGGEAKDRYEHSRSAEKAKRTGPKSPYTISVPMQIRLCMTRGFQRLRGDVSLAFTQVFGNIMISFIISSIFYNLPVDTGSFYSRGALLFFAILFNAFGSALEILTLYAQRPIVEKQDRYAFYHPYSEACASMIVDLPIKITSCIAFNLVLYFMTNLRRTPGHFFIFLLFSFTCTLVMSMVFRTIGACSRTLAEALAPAALFIMALIIYTGFTIPTSFMKPWFRWINYLNPIAYAFEALMVNEFADREFPCTTFVPTGPGYENVTGTARSCTAVGSEPGLDYVQGTNYLAVAYHYYKKNLWRNYGILWAFIVFFCFTYLFATEYISAAKSKGEVLVFKRGHIPYAIKAPSKEGDVESQEITRPVSRTMSESVVDRVSTVNIQEQQGIFQWKDVCYDIKIKGTPRRLLDHVDGWVEPGTLTALMGASGAGKTTLLDVLADRTTMGVISGDMFVNGIMRDKSFQRKTGYVQQQDLHLPTSTVREALVFSALLRQPAEIPKQEKIDYVDQVIKILEMETYAEAVVGILGEGLNVEQRKRLTIGVELAARPGLLLFLDEPTSGLDSQTAWSICSLMRKLANSGQAILCTIHQPSAILFQEFDRLLFLQAGGQTVYFGDIGENSNVLIDYFQRNGAHPCPHDANPAEWMLEVIGAAPGSVATQDWYQTWRGSPECKDLHDQLDTLASTLRTQGEDNPTDKKLLKSFATGYYTQSVLVTKRAWQQYWRSPDYIWSKIILCTTTPLFIGFSFYKAGTSLQGLQNQMLGFFMLLTMFGNMVQQIMPQFVIQRSLYEVRERPSKTYAWPAFMIANILVELPWQTLVSVIAFVSFYYPIGLYKNAEWTDTVHERGALFFLMVWAFFIFTSTFAHMVIAGIETAETGGNVANLLFTLCLLFCGVLATPTALPGFWIFMYRVSPFTYIVSTFLTSGVANAPVICTTDEYITLIAPNNLTCGAYLKDYIAVNGGVLQDPYSTGSCQLCPVTSTNDFLKNLELHYDDRWRNFGITMVYIIFNAVAALALYWLIRVPKGSKKKKKD